ncbi:MAG: homoserine dehydrogenase [Candidatus Binatia bacterium]
MASARDLKKVRIGLLGSGTVGTAIQELVLGGELQHKSRSDLDLEIVKIYTPHPEGKKWHAKRPELFTTDPHEVTDDPRAEIIVEALGAQQESHVAQYKKHILRAFEKGKSVVTSDKAVLARFGPEIWSAAARHNREIRFEACVGGGIPIVRSLTEGFSAEDPQGIFGIINGTCNYILSEMKRGRRTYREALREAQERGYAETDPTADTSGMDAEAKLILLVAVSFGLHVPPGALCRKGIEEIQPVDFLYAQRKGSCTIKHLASARKKNGAIEAMVSPVLVPHDHLAATIDGATNAMFFNGRLSHGVPLPQGHGIPWDSGSWNYAFIGPGAGGGPTAVAILGDVCDLARGRKSSLPNPVGGPKAGIAGFLSEDEIDAFFYLRFVVKDRTGIVADICRILGQEGINISEVWQLGHSAEELEALAQAYKLDERRSDILPFVITLERARLGQVKKALGIIGKQDFNLVDPVWMPIWKS